MKSTTEQFTKVVFSSVQPQQNNSGSGSHNSGNRNPDNSKKTKLNMFGKGITSIKTLNQQELNFFIDFKHFDLSHNAISNIQNLKQIPLRELNLSHNKIQDQQKLVQLFVTGRNHTLTKNIQILMLKGNPFLKKPLMPELKKWLFSVQNDLDLFSKQEHQFLQSLVQRVIEKTKLQSMLSKILINSQLIRDYNAQIPQDLQKLLLLRPQEFFKTLKRQMEWGIQVQPLKDIKNQVINGLPIQLFSTNKQVSQFKKVISRLTLQLKSRNQDIIKKNKETMHKIQGSIFNYLAVKKMSLQKVQKHQLNVLQSSKTPLRHVSNFRTNFNFQMSTPISTSKKSPSKIKKCFSQEADSPFYFNISSQNKSMVQTYDLYKQERNPFDQIIKEVQDQNGVKISEKLKSNQKMLSSSPRGPNSKRFDIKNGSKTLLELSQSLLHKPVVSDDSINFEFGQQNGQSQIQKMFNQILTKTNPIFHLLYSPLSSLKSSQKDQLITSLQQLLKDKLKMIEKLEKYKLISQEYEARILLYEKQNSQKCELLQANSERISHLQQQLLGTDVQINSLSTQLQRIQQQSLNFKHQNQHYIQELKKYSAIKFTRQKQQELEQKIRHKADQNLKSSYLRFLSKKSSKLNNFKQNMSVIRQRENQNKKQESFIMWKQEVNIRKKFKFLSKINLHKQFGQMKSTLTQTVVINKNILQKTNYLRQFITKKVYCRFFTSFKEKKTQNQTQRNVIRCYQKNLKNLMFNNIKENWMRQKNIQYDQIVKDFKLNAKSRMKSYVFREWLIYVRSLYHKEIQVRINHQGVLACNVVQKLCNYYAYQKSLRTRSLGLELYLRSFQKITYFHKFYKHISLQRQQWKLKLFKINMFTKKSFFQTFTDGVRSKQLKKKIKNRDEMLTKRKLQFNEVSQFKLRRILSVNKTKNKLVNCYFEFIKNKMLIEKKQIDAEKFIKLSKMQSFFFNLQKANKKKRDFMVKKRLLLYVIRGYQQAHHKSVQFTLFSVFDFMRKQHRLKRSLTFFFIKKNKSLMARTFYKFHTNVLQIRVRYFQQKLRQLGPDIQLIEQRQIKTNIQKVSLMRQMESKNQQLQGYERQVTQLKLLLEAKQIKYEKLKDIYAESIEINSRERQVYGLDEGEQFLTYEIQLERNRIRDRLMYQRQDKMLQKTLKIDSRLDANSRQLPPYTNKYSPQRDIKHSRQKMKVSDFVMEKRQISKINDQFERQKDRCQEEQRNKIVKLSQKQKISQFYPSFRRF